MKFFKWGKEYVTELFEVDQQHLHMVELTNSFSEKFSSNTLTCDDFNHTFKELAEYARYHFQEEERLMEALSVDIRHRKKHTQEHNQFIRDLTLMNTDLRMDCPDSRNSLLGFLHHWLAFHIVGTDQAMAYQIRELKKGGSAQSAYDGWNSKDDGATRILLDALNSLFSLVSERNRALSSLNRSLEEKVRERTRDLTETNYRLEFLATTDALTELPNRRHGIQQLGLLWQEAVRDNIPLLCMMIDADNFKEINDTYGHDAGDQVLRELARTLAHTVRTDDIVCRLGGDEFLIICPNTDLEGGLYLAGIVHGSVNRLKIAAGKGFWKGSISIGVALRSGEMTDHLSLVKLADSSLYAAKEAGRNCIRSCNDIGNEDEK